MERNDLWLAYVRDHPGQTEEELINGMRDVPQLLLDLLSSWDIAIRLLRDRVLGETDRTELRRELNAFEAAGYVQRRPRQSASEGAPDQWTITQSGQDYLRGRGVR